MVTVTADKVIVELEARLAQYNADVRGSARNFEDSQRRTRAAITSTEAQIRRSSDSIRSALRTSAAAIGAAVGIRAIANLADSYTRFTNQLRVAGLEGTRLTEVQNALFGQAQRYGVELEALGTLYGRVSQGARELGATQGQLVQFTNGVAAAIKIQGGDAVAARGALLQLSQALGGQIVRAEEFNSINEGARPILQAVANGIERYRGSVSRLRVDVINGRVTSQEFFAGFLRGSANLEAQATRANFTIGQSFTILNNALAQYIGQTNEAHSFSLRFSQAIQLLANNLDTVANALGVIAVIFGARLVAGLIAATGATFAFQAVMAGAATTMEATALVASTVGTRLLSAFGGPVGIAIAAITLGLLLFSSQADDAAARSERLTRQEEDLAAHLAELDTYARRAAAGISQVGSQAGGAVGPMLAFANATGEAAQRLRDLALARATELAEHFRVDSETANLEADAAQRRINARQVPGVHGLDSGHSIDAEADRRDRQIITQRSLDAVRAGQGYNRVIQTVRQRGLEPFLSGSEREGGRDIAGQLDAATRNLAVARRTGNRLQIQQNEAILFEVQRYRAYRAQGFLPAAATESARHDREEYERATGQGNATRGARAGAAAARAQARRAAAAERDAAGDAARFASLDRRANNDIAEARSELSGSAAERAQIEIDRLEDERINRNEELRQQHRQGQLGTGAEGQARLVELQRLNDERARLQTQVVRDREEERIRAGQQDIEAADLRNLQDMEQLSGDLSDSRQERLASSLRLVDISIDQERLELEGVLASRDATDAQRQIALARLDILETLRAQRRAGAFRQNESPIDAYLRGINKTGDQLNDDFQRIATGGLDHLNDGITDAITGAKSLGEAFHDITNQIIADLVRIAVQQLITRPLANALFGGPGAGLNGFGGGFGAIFNSAMSGLKLGRASGGNVIAGNVYPVGERGIELFKPSQSGMIIPNNRVTTTLGKASGGDYGGTIMNVNVVAPGANAQTVELIRQTLSDSAPMLIAAAQRATIRTLGRRRMTG